LEGCSRVVNIVSSTNRVVPHPLIERSGIHPTSAHQVDGCGRLAYLETSIDRLDTDVAWLGVVATEGSARERRGDGAGSGCGRGSAQAAVRRRSWLRVRGGPTMSQGYSIKYLLFLAKNSYIHVYAMYIN
jgi:hypothetical protein